MGACQGDVTFLPVARWQREFYAKVKSDPVLQHYPVFHSSEAGGSEPDNVGLQFLTIPSGAGTLMPDGTRYADYANVHNYICRRPAIIDNMACRHFQRGKQIQGAVAFVGALEPPSQSSHCRSARNQYAVPRPGCWASRPRSGPGHGAGDAGRGR